MNDDRSDSNCDEEEIKQTLPADLVTDNSCQDPQTCDMCTNYEVNLTKMQDIEKELREKLAATQQLANRYEKELDGERTFRKELELKLQVLNTETESKIRECLNFNTKLEDQLLTISEQQQEGMNRLYNELELCRKKCTLVEEKFTELSNKYQKLLGLNKEKASEMSAQNIELPQTVEHLQFLALQLREELIETRAAREHEVTEIKDELAIVREQFAEMEFNHREAENLLLSQRLVNNGSNLSINHSNASNSGHSPTSRYEYDDELHSNHHVQELEIRLSQSLAERAKLEEKVSDYRRKITSLKRDLDTCETVQKDFVRLSQDLQIQLEKIRQAEHEVRWQFEDDVLVCSRCTRTFDEDSKVKTNCRHCGKIFCSDCLSKSIITGPNNRNAAVCDVCYTLLNRESIPFFSNSLPISKNHESETPKN